MALPISGPFSRYPSEPFADSFQRGYRQKMPIDRPLEYLFQRYYGTSQTNSWFTNGSVSNDPPVKQADFSVSSLPSYPRLRQHAYNRAYEKLRASVMDTAGWAENFAQINKSRQLVVERSVQLAHFTGALRQRRFRDAARILRTPTPSGVSNRKAVSQNFLEYEFGVKPVISDIQETMKILTGDPFEKQARGRATERISSVTAAGGSFGSNPKYSYVQKVIIQGDLTITCRARVRVTSPNLLLANQLGLIDLALPWKLIPFSFIVDWFVNVEQVISSMTDWYGVELLDPHVSEFLKGYKLDVYWQNALYATGLSEGYVINKDKDSVEFTRSMGIPGPSLVMKPFRGFSLERGAQALSLVISVLGK